MSQPARKPVPDEGAFGKSAIEYCRAGLAVLPVSLTDKSPGIKGCRALSEQSICKNMPRWGKQNLGVWTGKCSKITVVDIDSTDNETVVAVIERFGTTPIMVKTPSGGLHLWYRFSGERGRNLRGEGLPVDIKGEGGYVIVPPSTRLEGNYTFIKGGLGNLKDLPTINPGALGTASVAKDAGKILKGHRNDSLFLACKEAALHIDTFETLWDYALAWNAEHNEPPLTEVEVLGRAERVWKYKTEGKLLVKGGEATVLVPLSLIDAYLDNPPALGMLLKLRAAHAATPDKEFAVSLKALTKAWKWTLPCLSAARARIIADGNLIQTHKGGKRPGDPNLYRLGKSAGVPAERDTVSYPNIIGHPAPPVIPPADEKAASLAAEVAPIARAPHLRVVQTQMELFGDALDPKPFPAEIHAWTHGVIPEVIALAIRRKIKSLGMRQADLARIIDISRPHLVNALRRRYPLSTAATGKLKAFLQGGPIGVVPA